MGRLCRGKRVVIACRPDTVGGRIRLPWWLAVVALVCAVACAVPASAGDAPGRHRLLERALAAYATAMDASDRDQRLQGFALSEQLFRQLVEGSEQHPAVRNATLYVNLGNAALQAERLGPAILAYRRALLLEPSHRQARQNLEYARSRLPEWIRRDSTAGLADTLFFWRMVYPRDQILAVAAVCFFLAALLLAAGMVRRQSLPRYLAIIPALAWLVMIISVVVGGNEGRGEEAVVVGQELVLHAADSENSPPRLSSPLPSGAEVRIARERGRWTEIEIAGGRSGWVLSTGLERVLEQDVAMLDRAVDAQWDAAEENFENRSQSHAFAKS